MDSTLKQRLIGAAVLAALAIIFLPMLLKGPDVKEPDAAEVPLSMPATPGQEFETRELPLMVPETTPPGGVLGMAPAASTNAAAMPVPDENAVAAEAVAVEPSSGTALPAATPIPTAAVAAGNYVVNIGSFSNLDNAKELAAKLRAANLPVTADRVTLASGAALRIRVGPYADRAAAEAARLRAETVTGSSSKVIVLDAGSSMTAATAAVSAGYAVQLSAPSVEAEALALRDRARGAGFSSFVQRVETEAGARFRVRVGPVADHAAAEALRDAVNGKLGTKGIVVANP